MHEIKIEESSNKKHQALLKKGLFLQAASIVWNLVEAALAVMFGLIAGSTVLLGFGIDSLIETFSAVIVGWRLQIDASGAALESVDKAEAMASKITGGLLFSLAAYVFIDASRRLLGYGDHAQESLVGIAITVAALIVMPFLANAKLKVGQELNSKALKADAMESACCAWFASATLVGLVLNAILHWWWADPVAGLVLVPLIVREGLEAVRYRNCSCHNTCDDG